MEDLARGGEFGSLDVAPEEVCGFLTGIVAFCERVVAIHAVSAGALDEMNFGLYCRLGGQSFAAWNQ